jgi:hypothetical protein
MVGVGSNGKEYGLQRNAAPNRANYVSSYSRSTFLESVVRQVETEHSRLRRAKHWKRSAVLDAFYKVYGAALCGEGYEITIVDVVAYEELQPLTYGVLYSFAGPNAALPGIFLALIVQRRSADGAPYLSCLDGVSLPVQE